MKSEKAREIKESLQQEIHLTEYVDSAYAENVSLDLLKDILSLINELERENTRLNKLFTYDKSVRDRCFEFIKDIKEEALKQFAKRLKEKFSTKMNWLLLDCVVKDIDETLEESLRNDCSTL